MTLLHNDMLSDLLTLGKIREKIGRDYGRQTNEFFPWIKIKNENAFSKSTEFYQMITSQVLWEV